MLKDLLLLGSDLVESHLLREFLLAETEGVQAVDFEFKVVGRQLLLCRQIIGDMQELMREKEQFSSRRLVQLLTFSERKEENEDEMDQQFVWVNGINLNRGLLPKVDEYLDEFENYIIWKQNVPEPVEGILPDYDAKKQEIGDKEKEFDTYLEEIRGRFNGDRNVNYAHTKVDLCC